MAAALAMPTPSLASSEAPPPWPPPEAWEVLVVPGIHTSPPRLLVRVLSEVAWPASPDPERALELRITLVRPDGTALPGVGWLSDEQRAAKVEVLLPESPWLSESPADQEEAAADAARRERELAQLLAVPLPEMDPATAAGLAERVDWLLPPPFGPVPEEIWRYRIRLEPFRGGEPLRQDPEPDRAPAPPRYTWGQPAPAGDPCAGRNPEDCVLDRLQLARETLCGARTADGRLRFESECALLTLLMNLSGYEIHCDLGTAAASASPVSLTLRLNGEYFLTHDCLDGVILHELTHLVDFTTDRVTPLFELGAAEERLRAARDRLAEVASAIPPDPAGLPAALAELQAAAQEVLQLRSPACVARLEMECRALFAVIDNRDILGRETTGLPWVVDDIQGMIHQQLSTAWSCGPKTAEIKAAQCQCLQRIRDWLDAHEPFAIAMRRARYTDTSTWREYLDALIDDVLDCP